MVSRWNSQHLLDINPVLSRLKFGLVWVGARVRPGGVQLRLDTYVDVC